MAVLDSSVDVSDFKPGLSVNHIHSTKSIMI